MYLMRCVSTLLLTKVQQYSVSKQTQDRISLRSYTVFTPRLLGGGGGLGMWKVRTEKAKLFAKKPSDSPKKKKNLRFTAKL